MKLSENGRVAAFALLVLLAIGGAAYLFIFSEQPDSPSDGREFYYALRAADKVGILYDVRGGTDAQATAAYQCGVDIISKGRFAGKEIENIACDDSGCLAASSSSNGSSTMSFEQARKRLASVPYLLIKTGELPSYGFFLRHMEIVIGKDAGNGTKCDIAATES